MDATVNKLPNDRGAGQNHWNSSLEFVREALADRYSIQHELGRGGMGIVYAARDLQLDRTVAIKVLPPIAALSEVRKLGFLREARLAASLSHPNIVPIHSLETTEDCLCFVMDYVRGNSLRDRIDQSGPMNMEAGLRVLCDIAWALDHAHARGIVHRDVKPGNIFIEGDGERALLGDFGIARGDFETLTATGVGKGTRGFGSPEQFAGLDIDGRSDLFGLGATGWYLFTGERPPLPSGGPPDLTERRPDLPLAVCQIIRQCLEPDPESRPSTARDMAELLRNQLRAGDPIPRPIRRWIVEPRTATIVLLLFTGTILLQPRSIASDLDLAWGIGGMWVVYLAYRIHRSASLFRAGYGRSDILSGLHLWAAEQARQRFHGHFRGCAPEYLARGIRVATTVLYVTLVGIGILIADVTDDPHPLAPFESIGLWALIILLAVGWLWPGWARQPSGLFVRSRQRFWRSMAGRWWHALVGVRRRSRRARGGDRSPADRHTELVLEDDVDHLFDRLPPRLRQELGSLPQVVAGLTRHTADLREGLDRLAAIRLELVPHRPGGGESDELVRLAGEIESRRERLQQRRHEVLAALERLRIGLLGLSAQVDTPGGLADTLAEASELRAHIARLSSALHMAEALLQNDQILVSEEAQPAASAQK